VKCHICLSDEKLVQPDSAHIKFECGTMVVGEPTAECIKILMREVEANLEGAIRGMSRLSFTGRQWRRYEVCMGIGHVEINKEDA